MRNKKILAAITVALFIFSFTACEATKHNNNYKEIVEELDFSEADEFDLKNFRKDNEGIYFTSTDEKDIKDVQKFFWARKNKLSYANTVFMASKVYDYEKIYIASFTFDNEKDAKAWFKEMDEQIKLYEPYDDDDQFGRDSSKSDCQLATYEWRMLTYQDCFIENDNTVTIIYANFCFCNLFWDDYEALYDAIGRDIPSDLIDKKHDTLYDFDDPTSETLDFYYD